MIFTYMCKTCGCSFRSRNFGTIERFIEPCILLLLTKEKSLHGYGLLGGLAEHCGEKVNIGNLYRTLRKMEANDWISSEWSKNVSGPDRRVYSITKEGQEHLKEAALLLLRTDRLIHKFLGGCQKNFAHALSI